MARRVMKHQPEHRHVVGIGDMLAIRKRREPEYWLWPNAKKQVLSECLYGQSGDRLWVRETWAHYQTVNHIRRPDGAAHSEISDGYAGYRADGFSSIEEFRDHVRLMSDCSLEEVLINGDKWRPSIHMPRWASRILLEITDVRVERLQDITDADAIAEGVQRTPDGCAYHIEDDQYRATSPASTFAALWAMDAKAMQTGRNEKMCQQVNGHLEKNGKKT